MWIIDGSIIVWIFAVLLVTDTIWPTNPLSAITVMFSFIPSSEPTLITSYLGNAINTIVMPVQNGYTYLKNKISGNTNINITTVIIIPIVPPFLLLYIFYISFLYSSIYFFLHLFCRYWRRNHWSSSNIFRRNSKQCFIKNSWHL